MGDTGIRISTNTRELPFVTRDMQMDSIERDMQGLDHMRAYLFDAHNNLISGFVGEKYGVKIRESAIAEGGTLVINHPNSNWGGVMSMHEIRQTVEWGMNELRVVGSRDDNSTYSVHIPNSVDKPKLINYLKSREKELSRNFKKSYSEQLRKARNMGMTAAEADSYARKTATGMYEKTISKTLHDKFPGIQFKIDPVGVANK